MSSVDAAVSSLISTLIRPEIVALSSYHVPSAEGMLKLDAMENPYSLPANLQTELGELLAQVALNRYPVPSYTGLKSQLCHQFGVPAGFDVVLGNGSDELISMLTVACARPQACVMAPVPTFVMYEVSARLAGMAFVGVPLHPDFSMDLPALLTAIQHHRPALLFIANPNNPTGSWAAEQDLVAVLEAMAGIGLVIVDEAYQPFAPDSMMRHLPTYPNLAVMRTVSKLGWAGLRLGYLSAANALLVEIDKVRPPYNINVLSAAAAEFLLDHTALFDAQAQQICTDRALLSAALAAIPTVEVFASQANFVIIRVPHGDVVFNKLLEQQVLVKNAGKMHPLLKSCLRITVGSSAENQQFLASLARALK